LWGSLWGNQPDICPNSTQLKQGQNQSPVNRKKERLQTSTIYSLSQYPQ